MNAMPFQTRSKHSKEIDSEKGLMHGYKMV